jgi:hypothetical protein
MGERTSAHRISVKRPEVNRPLGRSRRRLEDNIKMDLQEVGWCGMDWTGLVRDRDSSCECDNDLSSSIKCGKFLDHLGTC